ncbi:glycosyltransferase [Sphingomonas mollis]|uniref:Glycosyltransferase n=1 Tax=Sphingomonas mollis TaxID=2795726 RepID=A0ABS0XNT8_9SPHN|nr:glycosyltransferase [Sphingomonas sp. BT553]MBJ6121708.1 glycosyltransferase [Sphingomonas sp. BT553]
MMPPFCVCVPARNEAKRLPTLLSALATQDVVGLIPVAICLNNIDDDSVELVHAARQRYDGRLGILIEEHRLPPDRAHAGAARRIAMDRGLAYIDPDHGILISTDADCRPPAGWITANLTAMAAGVDMVGGRIVLDDAEPIPADLARIRHAIDGYWHDVREIEDRIDPCLWDSPPRHGDHTGASLAITTDLYRKAGGVPPIPLGEDRALVENGIAAGGRLAHPISVWTRTSSRRQGRATGGMATEMKRLEALALVGLPPLLPSFDQWRQRAAWRRAIRASPDGAAAVIREERLLPPMLCDFPLDIAP